MAGKITNPAGVWAGEKEGAAVSSFLTGALPNAAACPSLVAYGEVLVGMALIVGLLTGIASFFGGVMIASDLLAGTVSRSLLFILAVWLVLGWHAAGWWGLDRLVLVRFGITARPAPPAGVTEPRVNA